ncbi:PEP-CTERM sorting domain-containing protein [Pelodictyon phaeoclathratiforme]|jgi:hypothetical protein|uniref:Ice-binding protein C-terminal domain-containing protein n=1 Tax=Pelodictyon phaeoclathratiforme (strain DSM 5477 / BU-1) TaxID=324925 RepID=B4SDH6_PELPB|nr:PEP-CTERM sorting domain-containing protein [Pelodictyon phaeoclathratiforme]ACF42915.1 hypothetical protein Ppha_0613 [Pelodictyon phaeoclathratiforme BU-1]MBV5328456.1 PEP-CTERM sorting domain-containing protein [Chlorobium sp.]
MTFIRWFRSVVRHKFISYLAGFAIVLAVHPCQGIAATEVITFYVSDNNISDPSALFGALPSDGYSVSSSYRLSEGSTSTSFTDLYSSSSATFTVGGDSGLKEGYRDAPELLKHDASTSKSGVGEAKISFDGLMANEQYSVVVYSQGQNDVRHTFITNLSIRVGSGTYSSIGTLTTDHLTTYRANGNYLTYDFTTDETGKAYVAFYTNPGNTLNRAGINAVQLVYGKSPTPEPSTYVLMGVGALIAGMVAWKKNLLIAKGK